MRGGESCPCVFFRGRSMYKDDVTTTMQGTLKGFNYCVHNAGRKPGEKYNWYPGKFHKYICDAAQDFLAEETGRAFDILIITTPPQHGKGFEYNTPVLTTQGWKKHGELKAGDYVYSPNGEAIKVLASQKPYDWHCKKLTLDSGDSFICSWEHEWIVECNRDLHEDRLNGKRGLRHTETLEAQHIFDGYHAKSPAIKVSEPIKGCARLPIQPYLLGMWLGDGTSGDTTICCGKEDFENTLENLKEYNPVVIERKGCYMLKIGKTTGKKGSNWFKTDLRENGLLRNKHIPYEYFCASEEDRLELLRGLMDTDGSISANGANAEYCGVNKSLVEDVFTLVRSLGFKCSFITGDATINGDYKSNKYRIIFTPSKGQKIFKLTRKQMRVDAKKPADREDKHKYFIKSVEDVPNELTNCITVEGGVYLVGKGLIPTHNSLTITETLPAWYLCRNPDKYAIVLSYGDDLAQKFGRANLAKVKEYGYMFGVSLNKKKSTPQEFELVKYKGGMISKGFGSGVTGRRANLIVIDDPVKNQKQADSPTYRESIWSEFFSTINSRLSNHGKVIIIMTRWHEDDLAGRILASEELAERTTLVNLPCECEDTDDLLGRNIGDPLCPEPEGINKGKEWLDDFKRAYSSKEGVRSWNALYECRPSAREGNMLKREWWQYYKRSDYDTGKLEFDELIMSVDAAFKDNDDNDYVAIEVWGKKKAAMYLVDVVNEHLNFPDTLRKIRFVRAIYDDITRILIEDKANGSAIISVLKNEIMGIIPVTPDVSKEARVNAISFAVEAGNVYVPEDRRFTHDFVDQCSKFPNDLHDDMVDSASQALNDLIFRKTFSARIPKIPDEWARIFGKKSKSKGNAVGKGDKIVVI